MDNFTNYQDLFKRNEENLRKRLGLNPLTPEDYLIRQKVAEGYLPPGADDTFKAFLENSADPNEALSKLNSAKFYSESMNIPLQAALSSLPEISKEWWGKASSPISDWQAISESFTAGAYSFQLGNLWFQKMNDDSPELQAKIDELQEKMPAPDQYARSLPIRILKAAFGSIPYTASAGVGNLATEGLISLAAYTFAPTALALGAVKLVSRVAGMALTANSMTGLEYRDMIMAGIDPKVAKYTAPLSGWLQAAVESDQVKGLLGVTAAGKSVSSALSNGIDEAVLKGMFREPIIKFFTRQAGRAVGEGLEEGVQQAISSGVKEVARQVSQTTTGKEIAPETWDSVIKEIVDQTVMGGLAAIPMGILSEPISIYQDVREYNSWKSSQAKTDTKAGKNETKAEKIETNTGKTAEKPEPLPEAPAVKPAVALKSYESSPGIIEIRGTTDAEGKERKPSVRGVVNVDDEAKTVSISSLAFSKKILGDEDEMIRQAVEVVRKASADTGYQVLYSPKDELGKKVKSILESENPEIFTKPQEQPQEEKRVEYDAEPEKNDPGEDFPAPQPDLSVPAEEKAAPEAIKLPEPLKEEGALLDLQKQGAAKIETSLDEAGYKFHEDRMFPVGKILFNPELPNFKEGANKSGVVEKIPGRPEPMGMPPIVLWHTKDDNYYIVTGRHRLDLFKRFDMAGIPSDILEEEDGYTIQDMAIIDAEMNIRDGQGTEKDYERYFEQTGYSRETAERRGLLRGDKARVGFSIGTLATNALQTLYKSGKISGEKAAAIAEAAPKNEALQALGMRMAQSRENTADVIRGAMKMFSDTKGTKVTQGEMFDDTDSMAMIEEQLKISRGAQAIRNEISSELTILKQAAKFGAGDRKKYLEQYGKVELDEGSLSKRIETLSDLQTKWEADSWTSNRELYIQAKAKAGLATQEELDEIAPAPVDEATPEMVFEKGPVYGDDGKLADTPFKTWFGNSKVVDEAGKPKIMYSGHSNVEMYGDKYFPRKGTAGGFYSTSDPAIASNYSVQKFGNFNYYENGDEYRIAGKNGKYNKKLWQIQFDDAMKAKIDALAAERDKYGDAVYPLEDMKDYIESNKGYDKDVRRWYYRGGIYDLQNIYEFYNNNGDTIYHSQENPTDNQKLSNYSEFDKLLTTLGFDWNSSLKDQPGVMAVYLKIENPIDTSKPFPADLLAALEKKAKRERAKYAGQHWTKDYSLGEWVEEIKSDDGVHGWATQIPAKAMPILKSFGYDGIIDTGGKMGGTESQIAIAFDSTQIKSATGNNGDFDSSNPSMAREPAPSYNSEATKPVVGVSPWIYKAKEVVKQKVQGKQPGRQILKTLLAAGVKSDEIKWTGLDDFLDTDEKKTPQEVQDFIEANKIQINEVLKKGEYFAPNDARFSLTPERHGTTKYKKYSIPGGENYREILFTLPIYNDSSNYKAFEKEPGRWYVRRNNGQELGTWRTREDAIASQRRQPDSGMYNSPHWDEVNVLAHLRANDRSTFGEGFAVRNTKSGNMSQIFKTKEEAEAYKNSLPAALATAVVKAALPKKTLFIEEIQSDWHQEGRKRGYAVSLLQIENRLKEKYGESWMEVAPLSEIEEYQNIQDNTAGIPNAPLSKTWHEFVFKRALRMAVEEGYDAVAWTTGEQQAERYDLSKQIASVQYGKDNNLRAFDYNGVLVLDEMASESELENIIGKEVAEKLVASDPDAFGVRSLHGQELKVGGEGMKGFYDKILVDFANKYGKKWGASVQDAIINQGPSYTVKQEIVKGDFRFVLYQGDKAFKAYRTEEEANTEANRKNNDSNVVVHSLSITDAMRAAIPEGQYLFESAKNRYGVSTDKAGYREQMLKARELTKLMADNADGFFNDEIKSLIMANNGALIKALQDAKDESVAFTSSARPDVKAALLPVMDGTKAWEFYTYIDGEIVSTERFRSRSEAIVSFYTESAPMFGGAQSWSVVGAQPELFDATPSQIADIEEKSDNDRELFEYDEDDIKKTYGDKGAFDEANQGLQLNLFDGQESGNGDLFVEYGDGTRTERKDAGRELHLGRRAAPVSDLLGQANTPKHPAYKENSKGQRRVSLVGQTVSRPKDIAELFQVYRNTRVESMHFIYTDENGKILAHNAISSGIPGATRAVIRGMKSGDRYTILDRMARLGASYVYILHNHPSGDPDPSYQDLVLTQEYSRTLGKKFAGHVIIDHKSFNFINRFIENGDSAEIMDKYVTRGFIDGKGTYSLNLDGMKQVKGPDDLASYAASVFNAGVKSAILITDYQNRIIEWRPVEKFDLKKIYDETKGAGGSFAFFVTEDRDNWHRANEQTREAHKNGGKFNVVIDTIFSGDGTTRHNISIDQSSFRWSHYDYLLQKIKSRPAWFVMQDSLSDEAADFGSYDEFKKAYVAEGEDETEARKAWAARPARASEDFVSIIQDPEAFRNFLEANGADLFERGAQRKNMSVVDATSYRIATGGVVSDATIARTKLLVEKNAEKWAGRYAELRGEVPGKKSEADFEIRAPKMKGEDLSILKARQAEAVAALPEGAGRVKETSEELAARAEELKAQLEQEKKDLKDYQGHFSYAEKRIVDMHRELKDIEKELFVVAAKAKLDGSDAAERREELKTRKAELEQQIRSRTDSLSPQSGMKSAAYLAKQDAIKATAKELHDIAARAKAKKAERDLMNYYAAVISKPVSRSIDFKVGNEIRKLQAQLDPFFRRGVAAAVGGGPRPLNLWSLEDLQILAQQIEDLRDYGRSIQADKLFEQARERVATRDALQMEAKATGKERPSFYYGTKERADQAKADKGIFKNFDLSLETIHRVAKELDGGKEGEFYQTVVEAERDAFRAEKADYDPRIAKWEAKMKELGLDRDKMYLNRIRLGDQTISSWEAIALYIGSGNEKTEKAIIYGNMMSPADRKDLSDEEFYIKAAQNRQYVQEAIAALSPAEKALAEYLVQDGDEYFPKIAEATYTYENRIPEREKSYYPHERRMVGGEDLGPEEIFDQVMSRAGKAIQNVGKQPTINRIEIGDRHQAPINLDAYQVYRRGMERQAHYIAYAKFVSDMNSVFKNGKSAGDFRDTLRRYHGQFVLDYIDRWISEAANPKAFSDFNKPAQGIQKVFKILRGPLGVAYLGLRASRGVFQIITSPAPYLPYAGTFMVKRMVENLNPAEFMKSLSFAKENSAFIRHRVINPVDAYIKEYIDKTPSLAKRNSMAVMGAIMEWADMWSVSTGWNAVYEKTAAELKNSGKTAEEIHTEAAKAADRVTIETQPTYRHQDLSPAFKQDSEIDRFLLQFQTPLNVIYNQLFHDAPMDWKSGNRGRALGIVSGYLAVAGLMALITAPRADDDDEKKKARNFLSGAATAPLETIPLIGSVASGLVESLITGERFYRDDQIFPGVAKVVGGVSSMVSADDEEARVRAFWRFMEGSGMLAGVPTSAVKEYYRVIFKGDYGALWGRRE